MSIISEYKDSSGVATYPKPLTNHVFAGLSESENIDFKIWLGLIGENEVEISVDQALEIQFVEAFKDQRLEKTQFWNPAQKASQISFWFLQAAAGRCAAGLRHGCQFWQLIDWVPTQTEINEAFQSTSVESKKEVPVKQKSIKKPMVEKKPKEKVVRDEWTLDLFGALA